jgi:hypothetical protein
MVTAYDEEPPMDTSNRAHHDLSSRTLAISIGYALLVAQKMRGSVRGRTILSVAPSTLKIRPPRSRLVVPVHRN